MKKQYESPRVKRTLFYTFDIVCVSNGNEDREKKQCQNCEYLRKRTKEIGISGLLNHEEYYCPILRDKNGNSGNYKVNLTSSCNQFQKKKTLSDFDFKK